MMRSLLLLLALTGPLTAAELANWQLDETAATTTLADSSGNGETATLTGGATADELTTDGPGGVTQAAMQFESPNYAQTTVQLSSLSSAGSVSAWVKLDDGFAAGRIVGGTSSNWYLGIHPTGRVDFYQPSVGQRLISGINDLVPGIWYHIVLTWDGTTMRIYIDGTEVINSATITPTWYADNMRIGADSTGVNYNDGALANIYVFDHELNTTEIATLFGEGTPQVPAPITAPKAGYARHQRAISPLTKSLDFEVFTDGVDAWTTVPKSLNFSGTTYYVDADTGDDGNAGTSSGAPLATLSAAIAKTGDIVIYARGDFHWGDALAADGRFGGTVNAARAIAILRWGDSTRLRLINGPDPADLTWSASGGGVYTTTLPEAACLNVVDEGTPDHFGYATPLVPQADAGTVTSSGGWYRSGTTLTVKLSDGADPTSRVQVLADQTGQLSPQNYYSSPLWMEGVDLLGWQFLQVNGQLTDPTVITLKDVFVGYVEEDSLGMSMAGGERANLIGCVCAYPGLDGINWGNDGIGVEDHCVVYYAGWLGDLDDPNQCSTGHDDITVVRCGGIYQQAGGENIADVTGTEAWNLFIRVQDSRSNGPSRDTDYNSQLSTDAECWIYRGQFGDSDSARTLTDAIHEDGSQIPGLNGSDTYTQAFEAATSYGELAITEAGTYTYGAVTYQAQRADDDSGTNTAAISGASSSPYAVTSSDHGKYIRWAETSTNSEGSNTQYTDWVGPISAEVVKRDVFGGVLE